MFYYVEDIISSSAFGESPARPTLFLDVIPSEHLPLFLFLYVRKRRMKGGVP